MDEIYVLKKVMNREYYEGEVCEMSIYEDLIIALRFRVLFQLGDLLAIVAHQT